jgi:hypothetical protein
LEGYRKPNVETGGNDPMVNAYALASLTTALNKWMDDSCMENWWPDTVGLVTDTTASRMAWLMLLAMQEAKKSNEYGKV